MKKERLINRDNEVISSSEDKTVILTGEELKKFKETLKSREVSNTSDLNGDQKPINTNSHYQVYSNEDDTFVEEKFESENILRQEFHEEETDDEPKKKKEKLSSKNKTGWNKVMEWIIPVTVALCVAILIRIFVGGATTVQGNSMYSTLHNGDILIINKIPTYGKHYKRADIVVIDAPDDKGKLYIKRIVGLPGEKIRIEDGHVYINDRQLKEFYIQDVQTMPYNQTEWTLGEDEYFLMGDNREPGASNDSRLFGPVNSSRIEGVAVFRIWPLNRAGSIF